MGGGVPPHALMALALLLRLPGYAAALLDDGPRAVHLLRLLLGVTHDEDGRELTSTPLPLHTSFMIEYMYIYQRILNIQTNIN